MGAFLASVQHSLSVQGAPALGAALVWGIISILLSPCSLVLIPMVMGYIQNDDSDGGLKHTLLVSLAFSSGVFVNILVVGSVVVLGGAAVSGVLPYLNYFTAVVLFLFGMHLLELITLPGLPNGAMKVRGRGIKGALTLGLFSGLATGPCSLAYMAPMLVLAIKAATTDLLWGIYLVLAYAVGYALVVILAGLFSDRLSYYLQWNEESKGGFILSQICGWLVILAGAYFLYIA